MKVLQINTTANSGSHGRIAEGIGRSLIAEGNESLIAYGRTANPSVSELIKIGNQPDQILHLAKSRIIDRHGFGSAKATESFVRQIIDIDPDIIHLHNIHGYYLNVKVLFEFLKGRRRPVVWTFHDCWPFTGHCSYFDAVNCYKWQSGCYACPNTRGYPASWFIDNSLINYKEKRDLFTGLDYMVLVSPSRWLANHLSNSFLSGYEIRVIHNGVDLNEFKAVETEKVRSKYKLPKIYILGVANIWDERKGLTDFIRLRNLLDHEIGIVLVGLSPGQIKSLPLGIIGLGRTENTGELAALYSGAEVFVNPTYADNFPSVNIEALACGVPVVTYDTGGSPESIDGKTGFAVAKSDVSKMAAAVNMILQTGKVTYSDECRTRAEDTFDEGKRYLQYIGLYNEISKIKSPTP